VLPWLLGIGGVLAVIRWPRLAAWLAPVLATEVVPFVAVTLAIVLIVRNGAPPAERPEQISAASHQHLVAAT